MDILADVKKEMQKSLDHFESALKGLRTGRPSPSLIQGIMIDVYGSSMRLRDLGNVTVSDGTQLLVTPFDPSIAASIVKGIDKANLGLNAMVDGNVVRVPVPPMSEDRRKELVKEAREMSEHAKVGIRESRRKGNDLVKREKSEGILTEDDQRRLEKKIQELTDEHCKLIDSRLSTREKEILEV